MKGLYALFICLCSLFFAQTLSGQTTSWKGTSSTSWTTSTNWTAGVPTTTSDVIIGDANFTGVNQPTISTTVTVNSLTVGGAVSATLSVKRTTTVAANVTINANGSVLHTTNSFTVKGNWTNNGSYSATGTGCNVIFAGTAQSIQGSTVTVFRRLTVNAGSTTILNNNATVSGSSSITTVKGILNPGESPVYKITGTALTVASNAVLKVTGAAFTDNYTMSGTVTFSSNSTVEYSATLVNQTVSNAYTYSTLTISGAGIKTLAGNLPSLRSTSSSYGKINVNAGTLDLLGYTANRGTTVSGGTFTVANGAVLKIGGTNSFPANYTAVTLNLSSTVEYNGLAQTVSAKTYGHLKLSSSSGAVVKTMPATAFTVLGDFTSSIGLGSGVSYAALNTITINGSVNIGASTSFNGGASSHAVAGNWVNNGVFTGATSTISLTGGGSVISGTGTHGFNNLIIAATNITAAASSTITVAGNLSTTGPGLFTHLPGGSFTMSGGSKTISGTGITFSNLAVTGTIATASSLLITGNMSVTGTFTASTGTIVMNGTGATLGGGGGILFSALQVTGTVTASSGFSIASSLDVSGSFSASAGVATFTGSSNLNGTANLYSVTIAGSSLTLSSSSVLGIASLFTISSGSLDVTSNKPNTVNFNGVGAQSVNAIAYHHLSLTNGNTKTAAGVITVNGNLNIGAATVFSGSSFAHTLAGNWINNGSFSAGTSTVTLNGAANTSVTGATTFNILTISKSSSANVVSLLSNVSTPVINMTTGNVNTGTSTLTITSTRNGAGIIMGTITRTHTFSAGNTYEFEGQYNTINFSAASGVGSVTVYVAAGSISDFPNGASINRVYNITVPSGTYTATLRLHYDDAELNGNSETAMQLNRYNGSNWVVSGKTGNSITNNYVEQSGLTNISNRWTCSDGAGVVRWNGSVSSDWQTAANWSVASGAPSVPPSANDIVQIGTAAFTNQPSISTAITVKGIVFGSAQSATLTIASGGSLTSNGNINGTWSGSTSHTINSGSQALTVNGDLILSDGVTGHIINLVAAGGTIAVNGSLLQTANSAISFSGNTSLSIKNDFTHGSGAFTAGSGTVTYNGTGTQLLGAVTYNNLSITKASGIALANASINVGGNLSVTAGELDINANAIITGNVSISSGAGVYGDAISINVGGNWTNSGTFYAGAGTVVFDGTAAQTIATTTFNNLTVNKSTGTATLTGNVIVNSNLSLQAGTFSLATYTANRSAAGGQFTIANGASLLIGGANNFPQNYASNTLGTSSTVDYNGAVAQSVSGISYGNLSFSNGGATAKTLAATATVAGNITINSGATFSGASYTINLSGNWNNSGTYTPTSSTIVLNGTAKTITGNTIFNKITVYGSYTVANSDITYNGLLYVTNSGTYAAGSGTATVNGDLTNSGSLTSTGTTTFSGTSLQTIRLINALVSTSTGIVNFNGSVSPVLNSTSTPTFANLNINNTGGVHASIDWLVYGNMTIGSGGIFEGGISTHRVYGNFTNNGTVISDGVLNFTPSTAVTIKLSGTSFTSTGEVIFAGAGLTTITGSAAALHDVRIANTNAAGITPPSGWAIGNDFVVSSNAIFNAGSYSYTVAGDVESNGILNGGSSTFTMSSATGQLTGSPSTSFNHFAITGSVTANSDFYVAGNFTNNGVYDGSLGTLNMIGSGAATIGGTTTPSTISQLTIAKTGSAVVSLTGNVSDVFSLMINTGTLFTSTYSITQDAAGGILLISDGATLKLGGSNSLPGFSGYALDTFSTVDYAGVNQNVGNAANYGNLTISTAGTKQGFVPLIVLNDFTLSAGTFSAPLSVTHSIGGDWIMTGGIFSNASNTILFNGTDDQTISSTGAFNNMTINKATGLVHLLSNVTVNSSLNLTAGKISIDNYNLNMGTSGSIVNATAAKYIIANGIGVLNQQVTAGGSKAYPVGLPTVYTPATVTLTAGSTTDIIGLRMLPAAYHGGDTGPSPTINAVNATWMISEAVAGGSNATVTVQWPLSLELPGFNRTLSRLAHFTAGAWDFGGADIVATGTNPYSVTRAGFTDFSPFAVSMFIALPVTWLDINGRHSNNDNIINWSVASESNNEYYSIEYSTNGISYNSVGRVNGAGTTDYEQHYNFVHRSVTSGVAYYRIKQVDKDGKFSYSKVVKIVTGAIVNTSLTLLSNPVKDEIGLSITALRTTGATIVITDVTGKIVYRQKMKLNTGNNVTSIRDFNPAAGMYYCSLLLDDGTRTVTSPFVKK